MFDRLLRPLREIEGFDGVNQVPGLPEGMGAELTVFPPQQLLNMTAQCLETRAPFRGGSKSDDKKRSDDKDNGWGWGWGFGGGDDGG